MPYGRSRFRNRRRNRRRTNRYRRNRSSKRQAYQLARLDKRLSSLKYRFQTRGNSFTYYNEYRVDIPQITAALGSYGYSVLRIHPKTAGTSPWQPCLDQATQAQLSMDDWRLYSTISKFRISIGDEETNPIRFTAAIVQVKPDMRDITYYTLGSDLQGAFAPTIATNNTPNDVEFNPFRISANGMVFWNRKIFKILWKKEFTLGQVGYGSNSPAVRNIRDTVRDFTFKMNYGKYGTKLSRSQPDVDQALAVSEKTVNRRSWTYLIVISNDNVADFSAGNLEMTNVHYLRTKG